MTLDTSDLDLMNARPLDVHRWSEYPEVNALFKWLSQHGKPRMSGSGGSIFLPLTSQKDGLDLLAKKPLSTAGFVAKGMNIHPLLMS